MTRLLSKALVIVLLLGLPAQGAADKILPKRCAATTKEGTRCKKMAIYKKDYCRKHQPKDPSASRCKAVTKKGKRCPRAAKSKGYCSKHYMMKFPDRAMDKFDKTLDKL